MKRKIRISDLSAKAVKSMLEMLSNDDTTKIVGGCRWCPNPTPGGPYKELGK